MSSPLGGEEQVVTPATEPDPERTAPGEAEAKPEDSASDDPPSAEEKPSAEVAESEESPPAQTGEQERAKEVERVLVPLPESPRESRLESRGQDLGDPFSDHLPQPRGDDDRPLGQWRYGGYASDGEQVIAIMLGPQGALRVLRPDHKVEVEGQAYTVETIAPRRIVLRNELDEVVEVQ